jgi:hypothetical protein
MGTIATATLTLTASAPTTPASTPTAHDPVVTVLLVLLGSSVIAGTLTHVLTGLRTSAAARRDRYAGAVRLLISRLEYPYRIRRRTSDDPEILSALTASGHELQEGLAEMRAWIAAESRPLSELFDHCLTALDESVQQACKDAWAAPPISAAAQMNLNGFGPGDQQHIVTRMERSLAYRFGIRRLLPAFIVRGRLRRLGYLP